MRQGSDEGQHGHGQGQVNLDELAHQAMIDRGLEPDIPPEASAEAEALKGPGVDDDPAIKDLTSLMWCSIDNDDSRDLDQLSVAEDLGGGRIRVMVAVADVDALVKKGSAIDEHAQKNTTSVYTASEIFPMLPEKLSTNLTSLNQDVDRLATVTDMQITADGNVEKGEIYRAHVHNKAKLAYNSVAAWLEGKGEMPAPISKVPGLDANLRLQDKVAQQLRERRHEQGALDLETIEGHAVMKDGKVVDLTRDAPNRAKQLIEEFMVAANGVTARFLDGRKYASIRRVVRSPERWDRIEKIASDLGDRLPPDPDVKALEEFLVRRRKLDPMRFPDLSLSIVKAMGAGEYVLDLPGAEPIGHFGLAVRDYTHSTAPNRRYPDLITQRLVKAALKGAPSPYSEEELGSLATHCTEQEDAANKVERQMRKSAAAALLSSQIGQHYDAVVTGASEKGTWVRVFHPPVEGKLVHGQDGLDIGDRVNVKLIRTDIEQGFIDFVRAGH